MEDYPSGGTTIKVPKPDPDAFSLECEMLPGTRYQLDRILGDGGAGQVFRALHLELEKPVAVKVLHSELSKDLAYAQRFKREAKAAARICNPGVVEVTDFGSTSDGRLFLVMELIEGQTLAEVIQHGPFEPRRALTIAARLCDVLQAVHDAGIVHRDVKPSNVFLLRDDQIKLVDFGIARAEPLGGGDWRITKTGIAMGTTGYMAPEQAEGREVDARADLYSVGSVLFELLTGVPSFKGDTPVQVLMSQLNGRVEKPSKVVPGQRIPREVDRVVRRLLALKAERRFSSAAEVATLLHKMAERTPSLTDTMELGARASRPGRLGSALVIAAALLVVGAGVAIGFWANTSRRGEEDVQINAQGPEETVASDLTAAASIGHPEAAEEGEAQIESTSVALPPPATETPATTEEPLETGRVLENDAPPAHSERVSTPAVRPVTSPPTAEGQPSAARPRPPTADNVASESSAATPRDELPSPSAVETEREAVEAPDSTQLLRQARIAAIAGRTTEAEQLYRRARAAGADRASVSSGLGRLALNQGRHTAAVRELEQAIALRPSSTGLMIDLGRAYQGAGRTADAVRRWRAVLLRDPENARAARLLRSVGQEP